MADVAMLPADAPSSHGIRSYYGSKLDELEVIIREKTQNLARLSAQRNALNTRGTLWFYLRLHVNSLGMS